MILLATLVLMAHDVGFGPVKPAQALPAITVTDMQGGKHALKDVLKGKTTALQLVFTSCTATCPIQGAIFADAQASLPDGMQLVSFSIDPANDDVKTMGEWLVKYHAGPHWTGVIPNEKGAQALLDALKGRSRGPDSHTAQAYIINAKGELVYRTTDMPAAADLVTLMKQAN